MWAGEESSWEKNIARVNEILLLHEICSFGQQINVRPEAWLPCCRRLGCRAGGGWVAVRLTLQPRGPGSALAGGPPWARGRHPTQEPRFRVSESDYKSSKSGSRFTSLVLKPWEDLHLMRTVDWKDGDGYHENQRGW